MFRRGGLILALALAFPMMLPPGLARAQYNGMSREEWVNLIQKQVQERQDQARKKIEEEDAVRKQAEENAKAEAEALARLSAAELAMRAATDVAALYFDPADNVVISGLDFSADVMVRASMQRMFNIVDLAISYDPIFLAPVSVHDDAIRPLAADVPLFTVDRQRGAIRYQARLKQPQSFFSQRLLTIVWRPLRPADSTMVDFVHEGRRSYLRLNSADLLSNEIMPDGAMVAMRLTIMPEESSYKRGFLPPGQFAAYGVPSFTKGPVWLEMIGPSDPVEAGQEFTVQVHLRNPQKTQFDTVSLWIRYPPDRIEVQDWDLVNWIRAGINIHDGASHDVFPFDFHVANKVYPESGDIVYRMGVTNIPTAAGGLLASIRAKALAPASAADFQFLYGEPGALVSTEVSFLGANLRDIPALESRGSILARQARQLR